MFSKHHYLSHSHNNSANVFVAYIDNQLAGFISILHFPHPKVKNIKRVHRLVILPEYQGLGFGLQLLQKVGEYYKKLGFRYRIMTSAPSLINALKKHSEWKCDWHGRKRGRGKINNKNNSSVNRITVTFELIKENII